MSLPRIMKVPEETRKKCGHCEQKMHKGDLAISYISSAYAGHVNERYLHFKCFINNTDNEIGFELAMMAIAGDQDEKENKKSKK